MVAARNYDTAMDDLSREWADRSQYDVETADAMLKAGRYLYVLFCCQQAVEKALKAAIVQRTNKMPPRIHQLMRLVELARVAVEERHANFLRELSNYYIPSRYPEEAADLASAITGEDARRVLAQSMEFVQWLNSISR